jgi:O-antigen/teichoic acid export membrane protein
MKINEDKVIDKQNDKIKSKTIQGLFLSFFERIALQAMGFVISIILARLLMPAEFGLIAILMVIIAVAQLFVDSGFGQALIQKSNSTRVDESTIFYFNILVGLFSSGLMCLTAPWIARLYDIPQLVLLVRIVSLNLIINSFSLVQSTLLAKSLDFKTLLKISIIPTIMSGGIGIVMAYKGFGVWSLIVQSISSNLFKTGLLWMFCRWRPILAFSYNSLKDMFGFGSKLLATRLLDTIYSNIYTIIIGKIFSPADLGLYSRANNVKQLPIESLTYMMDRVTYPVFSHLQNDLPRLKRALRKSVNTLALITFPMMVGLSLVATPIISVLFTDKWLPSVPYLQVLSIVGIFYPLEITNGNMFKAIGHSGLLFNITLIKRIWDVIVIAITFRWGIMAMIYGQLMNSSLFYLINLYITQKLLKYTIYEQLNDLMPIIGSTILMALSIVMLNLLSIEHAFFLLILQVVTGVIVYSTTCYLFRIEIFMEIFFLAKPKYLLIIKQLKG